MSRPRLELAEIVRSHAAEYLQTHGTSLAQQQVLRAVLRCRTAELGGHLEACDHCEHRRIAYNSCRNRHCPKCQGSACARWMQARAAELLPVPYYHVVFTLPTALAPLALQNPRVLYGLLFRAASETLLEVAANPKRLGARIGFLAVLHTWGQNLLHHPHLHCVVPSGGISLDNQRWVRGRKGFLLPVRVLSRVFRGKFIAGLKRALERKELAFHGQLTSLADAKQFERLLAQVVRHDWVVYSKRPFGGPRQVLKYLSRYTHRVAISNRRLVSHRAGQVTFRWKDYRQGQRSKLMTLTATEFLRRFLLHVLPKGLMKIRHYGFYANRDRAAKLDRCRRLLKLTQPPAVAAAEASPDPAPPRATGGSPAVPLRICPQCGRGHLHVIEVLRPISPDTS